MELCCPCRNVVLTMDHIPTVSDTPFWVNNYFTISRGTGLTKVSATTKHVPLLCEDKQVKVENQTWSCLICLNCDTFIFADKNSGDGRLYVNLALQKPEPENQSQRTTSQYSPVWKILLREDEENASSVLEPPAVEDESRYHVFKLLQTQMQNFLLEEEMAMQQRIKEFEQKQKEELRELKSRSYKDRKTLWYTIEKYITHQQEKIIVPPTLPQSLEDTKTVIESNMNELESIEKENVSTETNLEQEPVNTWKNTKISDKMTASSEWLFQFDDDDDVRGNNDNVDDNDDDDGIFDDDFDDDFEIAEPENLYEDVNDTRAPGFHMAASVPVNIPTLLDRKLNMRSNNTTKKTSQVPAEEPVRASFSNSVFEVPGSDTRQSHADQEILSKSFAIPLSRNRVRAWL